MKDSHTNRVGTQVAYCNGTLHCVVLKKSIEGYGINVSVSNGSLSIKRSSRNMANGNVEFWCRVQPSPPDTSNLIKFKFILSLECKFTYIVFSLKTPPSVGFSVIFHVFRSPFQIEDR